MRKREAEGFADDLRGGGGAEKLAASTGTCAGATAYFGGVVEGDLVLRKTRSDGLDFACIFTSIGE